MDSSEYVWLAPLIAFLVPAIGWGFREYWQRRKAKRQAAGDAGEALKDRKTLLKEMISNTRDASYKKMLRVQLGEVNAALLGLLGERLRSTLKDAGLPTEDTLIADGRKQLQSQQVARLQKITKEVEALPPLVITVRDLLLLGNIYYYMQQLQDAKKYYGKLLELNPNDSRGLNNRAIIYSELGRHQEALVDYNHALEFNPDNPLILMNRGVTYHRLKRYDEALVDYNRSLQIKPDDPQTLNNRGATRAAMGKHEEALADYNRSLELYEHPHTLYNRGRRYKDLKQYADAFNDFRRSLELKPEDSNTLYESACLFSLWGKSNEALDYLKKAIGKDKKHRKMAKTDKDFNNIREDPRFKKLIGED
jgi:tetratricopeptide (TPR) repeat protein